jgi:hypothetical protein
MQFFSTCIRVGILVFCSVIAAAQQDSSSTAAPTPDAGTDANPIKPVIWSLRNEYYNLPEELWNNVTILRLDHAYLRNNPKLFGKTGVITRMDIPLVIAGRTDGTKAGLGDWYGQFLLAPFLTQKFAIAMGSGLSVPTATDPSLGTGKLTIAPALVPIWFIPKRGLFYIKVQHYISVAGAEDRPDLHYTNITPLLLWRLKGKPSFFLLDAESTTNWKDNGHTGYRAGFLYGRMLKKNLGLWIKAEAGIGPYRVEDFAVKTSLFKVR